MVVGPWDCIGAVPGEGRVYGKHPAETEEDIGQSSSQQECRYQVDWTVLTRNRADIVGDTGDRGVVGAVGVSGEVQLVRRL